MARIRLPHDGILLRSLLVTLLAFIVASVGSILYTAYVTGERATKTVDVRLNQLLDTVELTIKTACFVNDEGLAREVAQGLLSNSEILRVTISAGSAILADERKPGDTAAGTAAPLMRKISSPFKPSQTVGEVQLHPNPATINQLRHEDIMLAVQQLAWQLFFVSLAIFAALTVFFVRPVSRISLTLHHMNPAAGDRLEIPPGHDNTEIGRLVRDVNELSGSLVAAIDEAKQARLAAEDASNAKSTFLANMSHEIRTPLSAVTGLARIGARDSSEYTSRTTFERILRSGEHLLGVINDILDFSKIEAGKLMIERQPLRLADVVEEALALVGGRAAEKRLQLHNRMAGELPAWVTGDVMRIRQILVNLLSNAIKFTESGSVDLVVERGETGIRFSVRDEGIGMTAEQVSRLFKPFEQADGTTTRKYGGTGLGLAISMNLATLMGGRIEVASETGKGSCFSFELPLAETTEPPSTNALPSIAATAGRLAGYRVLAAEDVELNRLILEDLLREAGATYRMVEDGKAAVEEVRAESRSFDIVLMDIQMPVMDGHEATRHIRALAPHLPVIGLTAHALAEERDKCLASGMCDHVTKPITPSVLIASILRALNAPQASEPIAEAAPDLSGQCSGSGEIDILKLHERFSGKPEFILRVLQTFLKSQGNTPEQLRVLASAGDCKSMVALAHNLKGVTGNLAAVPLMRLAQKLEQAARDEDSSCAALAAQVAEGLELMLHEARQHLEASALNSGA
jgi:signal transduction histidine kinase/CheY-like chemotaxis protein/HPt (histidine-containing phosphotransfer) domain-containing protein